MPGHIADHQRDRAIRQWDCIEPVTSDRLVVPSGQVTCRDSRPWQHRQRRGQQRFLQRGHSARGSGAALIGASGLLLRPVSLPPLVSHQHPHTARTIATPAVIQAPPTSASP